MSLAARKRIKRNFKEFCYLCCFIVTLEVIFIWFPFLLVQRDSFRCRSRDEGPQREAPRPRQHGRAAGSVTRLAGVFFFSLHLIEVKFTWHKITHFKVNGSVIFSIFTISCNHQLSLVPRHFHPLQGNPIPIKHVLPHLLPHGPQSAQPLFLWISLLWIFHINGTM